MEIACKQEYMEDTFRSCCRFIVFLKIILSFFSPRPSFLAFLPSSGEFLSCPGQGMLFPKRCVRTGCCNQLGSYWYWREQEGIHGLVFVFFFFSTAWQLWCTFTQPLIYCKILPFFNKISSPHLVFVQLIILQSGILHVLLFVLSDHFSTLISSSWSKSIPCWKCKTRADPSVGFICLHLNFPGEGRRITEFNRTEQPSWFP